MKFFIAAGMAILIYMALGQMVGFTNHAAIIITLLGSFGAVTYKAVLSFFAFWYLSVRLD
jgi:hypothetical protein